MIKLDAGVAIAVLVAAAREWGDRGVPTYKFKGYNSIAYQVDASATSEYEWIEAVIQDDGSTIFYGSK